MEKSIPLSRTQRILQISANLRKAQAEKIIEMNREAIGNKRTKKRKLDNDFEYTDESQGRRKKQPDNAFVSARRASGRC